MNEKQLEEFLRENKPRVQDDPTFLLELQQRMQAVDGIKCEVDRQRRYGRKILLVTLIVGMLLGAFAVGIAYLFPADLSVAETGTWDGIRAFLTQWKRYLMLPFALCAIGFALVLSRDRSRVRL